jgi:hypothetical protein
MNKNLGTLLFLFSFFHTFAITLPTEEIKNHAYNLCMTLVVADYTYTKVISQHVPFVRNHIQNIYSKLKNLLRGKKQKKDKNQKEKAIPTRAQQIAIYKNKHEEIEKALREKKHLLIHCTDSEASLFCSQLIAEKQAYNHIIIDVEHTLFFNRIKEEIDKIQTISQNTIITFINFDTSKKEYTDAFFKEYLTYAKQNKNIFCLGITNKEVNLGSQVIDKKYFKEVVELGKLSKKDIDTIISSYNFFSLEENKEIKDKLVNIAFNFSLPYKIIDTVINRFICETQEKNPESTIHKILLDVFYGEAHEKVCDKDKEILPLHEAAHTLIFYITSKRLDQSITKYFNTTLGQRSRSLGLTV